MLDILKVRIKDAMRAGRSLERDILKLVVSEIEMLASSKQQAMKPVSEDQVHSLIRKIIEGNNITLAVGPNEKLTQENEILTALVPVLLTQEQILELLNADTAVIEQIRAAKDEKPATGIGVRLLKSKGVKFSGSDVAEVVKELRKPMPTNEQLLNYAEKNPIPPEWFAETPQTPPGD